MKKRNLLLMVLVLFFAFTLVGCKKDKKNQPVAKEIVVTAVNPSVTIKDTDVAGYDFKNLFTITEDNVSIEVLDSYINHTAVTPTAGSYSVTCTYSDKFAVAVVIVTETKYEVVLAQDEITLYQSYYDTYDYKALFTVKIDGKDVDITDEMIDTNIQMAAGEYYYKVTVGTASKTLVVHITDDHEIEVICTYPNIEIAINDLTNFDYTSLFSLYVDGAAVKVESSMIDTSSIINPVVGNSYEVILRYSLDKTSCTKTSIVNVVEESAVIIKSRNIVTYPNSDYIDLTSLFSITKGNTEIPVTLDMISGTIDYSSIGENIITLHYNNEEHQAIVEVKRGVIINYATSDTVLIAKGTNLATYAFEKDFAVTINGIDFTNIQASYFDIGNINFNEAGTYQVTLTIPYNENKLSLSGVKFTYFEATISYVVVQSIYEITKGSEIVILPTDTTSYNVYKNLTVEIDGRGQALVENKTWVSPIACYVETLSEPLDFTKVGYQEVRIAVYVFGVEVDPVIVTYQVIIDSDVEVNANDSIIFSGDTIYTKDLFSITENGEAVEVTYDMVTGKIDSFTPGIYYVTINYKNIIKEAKVVVLDSAMKGTYTTTLTTIPKSSGNSEDEEEVITPGVKLKDIVISESGEIFINNEPAKIINAFDATSFEILISSYEHYVYYYDGILVLDPDNSIRLGFNDYKRPLVYFQTNLWEIETSVTINYSDNHILLMNYSSYSIDTFKLKSLIDSSELWYGLKIHLVDKTASDTIYNVTWGEVEYADDFKMEANAISSLVFDDETYLFTMKSSSIGKISKATQTKKYVGMVFEGLVDGEKSMLVVNQYEGFALTVGKTQIFSIPSSEYNTENRLMVDYDNDIVTIKEWTSNVYSYKFILDVENLTFTVVEQDGYYGKYTTEGMYIYLDGYGTGMINFDTASYKSTMFTYTTDGDTIMLRYQNTLPNFKYGKTATLVIDVFRNVLTARSFEDKTLNGKTFENSVITIGAIVHINSYNVGQDSDSVAKKQLLANIEIITKDGVLDEATKNNNQVIDTSRIKFSQPGFYQFTITIDVNGKKVTNYYAVQVIASVYDGNPVVGTYGNGVIVSSNSLSITKFGEIRVVCSGVIYTGNVKIATDNSFVADAYNDKNEAIRLTGEYLAPGIIKVRCSGMVGFYDIFTTGMARIAGTNNLYLREIAVSNNKIYLLSSSATAVGEVVTCESLNEIDPSINGSIVKISLENNEYIVKVKQWTSVSSGLEVSDAYRGIYTLENNEQLSLDGFGTITIGNAIGTYKLNSNVITVTISNTTKVYRLNNTNYTYEVVDISLDNSLVMGNIYKASYTFFCGSYSYTASTEFIFGANGVVIVKSTSAAHDDGEDSCEEDRYEPPFASASGVNGTYFVSGDRLTIVVNGYTFVFEIDNVLRADKFTCVSTTLESGEHGHFKIGITFSV